MTLTLEMLPAGHGDALWIEHTADRQTTRLLIDGGPPTTYDHLLSRVQRLPADDRRIDLLVISHVDTDHIDGVVTLLLDEIDVTFGEIWFNGRAHVTDPAAEVCDPSLLGGVQGQVLSAVLMAPRYIDSWNRSMGGCAVVVRSDGDLPTARIGPLTLTLLSPRVPELETLAGVWDTAVKKALKKLEVFRDDATDAQLEMHLSQGNFDNARKLLKSRYAKRVKPPPEWDVESDEIEDPILGHPTEANGSSIAFLMETEGREKAVVLAADADAAVLVDALDRLAIERDKTKLRLDALKVSHHGSKYDTKPALLRGLDCHRFLFSTDGTHGHNHPDDEAIETILAEFGPDDPRPELYFNYLSHRTRPWIEAADNGERYTAVAPSTEGHLGLVVEL